MYRGISIDRIFLLVDTYSGFAISFSKDLFLEIENCVMLFSAKERTKFLLEALCRSRL